MLGLGLLCAPKIKAFRMTEREKFKIQSSKLGYWLLCPLTIVYVVMNLAVIVLSWIPPDQGTMSHATQKTLPYFTGPVAALIILCFGVIWWSWDCHILPRLGYVFWPEEKKEYHEGFRVNITIVTFNVSLLLRSHGSTSIWGGCRSSANWLFCSESYTVLRKSYTGCLTNQRQFVGDLYMEKKSQPRMEKTECNAIIEVPLAIVKKNNRIKKEDFFSMTS